MVYSTYCNSYPRALMELETYTGNSDAMALLEKYENFNKFWFISDVIVWINNFSILIQNSCRIKQENLPELPLSAHLLAPIQRICRYPLHLSELVKHSLSKQDLLRSCENDHLDIDIADTKETFEFALTTMKRVTEMVNEGEFFIFYFFFVRFQ